MLSESVKIGRAVAQSRPAQTNAIFDCKVLSRHHALLWYENGKVSADDEILVLYTVSQKKGPPVNSL